MEDITFRQKYHLIVQSNKKATDSSYNSMSAALFITTTLYGLILKLTS